ncbi:MAG TPA: hypothetical protein VFX43_08340 [Chitinophagaceae bacterium]|nr:hypothetical protein [Chitinophagaceae bacterium]
MLVQIQPYGSVSQELINYGYEKDRSWEREFEDVVPDLSESHPSIKPTEKYIRFKRRFNTLRAMRGMVLSLRRRAFVRELTNS